MVEPEFGAIDSIIGLFAFGLGLVLLVVGRAELSNEKFFATVASLEHESNDWHRRLFDTFIDTTHRSLFAAGTLPQPWEMSLSVREIRLWCSRIRR